MHRLINCFFILCILAFAGCGPSTPQKLNGDVVRIFLASADYYTILIQDGETIITKRYNVGFVKFLLDLKPADKMRIEIEDLSHIVIHIHDLNDIHCATK
jgi:hypothetical protein